MKLPLLDKIRKPRRGSGDGADLLEVASGPRRPREPAAVESKMSGRDELGPTLNDHDQGASARVNGWVAWTFAIYSATATLYGVSVTQLAAAMQPLQRVVPMFLTVSPRGDQIVRAEPAEVGTNAAELMTQVIIRDYVRVRETILRDEDQMLARWGDQGYLWHWTEGTEFKRFIKSIQESTKVDELFRARAVRTVHFLSDPVKVDDGFYRVDLATVVCGPNEKEWGRTAWTASVTVDYVPQEVSYQDQYMNPIGLQVVEYSLKKKTAKEAGLAGGCAAENSSSVIEALARLGQESRSISNGKKK